MLSVRYFEDVDEGAELPLLEKRPTTVSLFMYDVAIWATHRIHYDQEYARSEGYPDVVIVGPMQTSYIVQLLTNWAGDPACLKKLSSSHRALAHPGDVLAARAVVRRKYVTGGEHCVDFDVWVENQHGKPTTIGSATLRLPSKERAKG